MWSVTISIPQELLQKTDSIAIDEGLSRLNMIEILLKKYCKKHPGLDEIEQDSKSEKYSGFRKELISHFLKGVQKIIMLVL